MVVIVVMMMIVVVAGHGGENTQKPGYVEAETQLGSSHGDEGRLRRLGGGDSDLAVPCRRGEGGKQRLCGRCRRYLRDRLLQDRKLAVVGDQQGFPGGG